MDSAQKPIRCTSTTAVFFHGHCIYADSIQQTKTRERTQEIRDLGYTVIEIYECEFKGEIGVLPIAPVCTREDMINAINTGESFGIIKCDIHVPDHLISHFSEFPPIFKNVEIKLDDIGSHMQQFARDIGRKTGVKRSLISSMFGKGIVILTPLFQKYIEMGLICTNIEWILEYNPVKVYDWFRQEVSDNRRAADQNEAYRIRGETSKTRGNCAYGNNVIDKSKHTYVGFYREQSLNIVLQNPLHKNIEQLAGGLYEAEKKKEKIIYDNPIQIGIAVYSYAKLSLINFWQFINKYLINGLYQLVECDTDSLYIAFARKTIDECVKPELLEEWKTEKWKMFSSQNEDKKVNFYFDEQIFEMTEKEYDKRTPGKYKEEFSGTGMICLNSKVYHIWNDEKSKTSCKGIQKKRNELLTKDFNNILKKPITKTYCRKCGFFFGQSNISYIHTIKERT